MPMKVHVFSVDTGEAISLYSVDAREAVKAGHCTYDPAKCKKKPTLEALMTAGFSPSGAPENESSGQPLPPEMEEIVADELKVMGVPQLRELAKQRNIVGYSTMTKEILIQHLAVGRGQVAGSTEQMVEEEDKGSNTTQVSG